MSIYLVIFLSVIGGLVGGMAFAVPFTWTLRRFVIELEYRVDDLEGRISREVKKRGQEASVAKRAENTDLDEWAKNQRGGSLETVGAKHKFNDWWNQVKKKES